MERIVNSGVFVFDFFVLVVMILFLLFIILGDDLVVFGIESMIVRVELD